MIRYLVEPDPKEIFGPNGGLSRIARHYMIDLCKQLSGNDKVSIDCAAQANAGLGAFGKLHPRALAMFANEVTKQCRGSKPSDECERSILALLEEQPSEVGKVRTTTDSLTEDQLELVTFEIVSDEKFEEITSEPQIPYDESADSESQKPRADGFLRGTISVTSEMCFTLVAPKIEKFVISPNTGEPVRKLNVAGNTEPIEAICKQRSKSDDLLYTVAWNVTAINIEDEGEVLELSLNHYNVTSNEHGYKLMLAGRPISMKIIAKEICSAMVTRWLTDWTSPVKLATAFIVALLALLAALKKFGGSFRRNR